MATMTATQIAAPIMGLLITYLVKAIVISNTAALANVAIMLPVPYFYNVPMKALSNFENIVFNVSECDEWYMYSFEQDTPEEDKEYFGSNPGQPMRNPQSKGMLSANTNLLTVPC